MRSPPSPFRVLATAVLAVSVGGLAACGGGSGPTPGAGAPASPASAAPAPAAPASTTKLSGTVAVGAPIGDGRLRVVDADGQVVATDVPVDADGRYADVALTGRAPWRVEACGHAGSHWLCLASLVNGPGTGHVTPLTDAMARLGGGSASGSAATQATLRTALASLMSDAGLGADFDFTTGELAAGSRTGYDRLLDAIGVTPGEDGRPFVQITPRLGSGNLYIEQDAPAIGSLQADSGAARVPLAGLETLFRRMSAAIASPAACADAASGMQRHMATDARLAGEEDGAPASGAAAVARALCGMFGGGPDEPPRWGSTLTSPVLGRCDFTRPVPVCRVTFAMRAPDGTVGSAGHGLGVAYENGEWRFFGDADGVRIHASARVQRDRRIDGAAPVDQYMRALAFEVPARPGLACARVSQRDAGGALLTVAYFKRHAGAARQARLSLWTQDAMSNQRSLDPATGTTRSADDTWLLLPEGSAGDAVIRNFYRGGRTVIVDLYSDAACTTGFAVDGRSRFEVELEGVPPVWAAMVSLPWPDLTDAASASLRSLALPAGPGSASASWTFPRGTAGIDEASFCTARVCGDGSPARVGSTRMRPGAAAVTVPVNLPAPLAAAEFRMLTLYGRGRDGSGLQANFVSCPSRPAGQLCQ